MSDENIVRLRITSLDRTPEEITTLVGLMCDRSWHIGDKRSKTVISEITNGWILNSGLPKSASLETHIQELLERLTPHASKIQTLSHQASVELSIVVYASTPPALNFDKTVIRLLSQLGASLDIDLYVTDNESS